MSASILRVAARGPATTFFRANPIRPTASAGAAVASVLHARTTAVAAVMVPSVSFSAAARLRSEHHEESFEEFTARFEKEFDTVQDVFELQRNLNNAFAYDLVPSPSVLVAALKAARRVNDYPTAVRVFEGIKAKVENKGQYEQYLEELKPLREELGIVLKEELFPEETA
ncbi:cytochrome c oxidase subunit [Grosmannia clavigera kw1407]|uniref:Cytochrome c oxidase subunit 6, mitochondrial n=1 Tax=Grosmannia clavigera (strain kw1407 / UAMH 11150) TaxID=655863 RepID=F0XG61_GROCL|nr:cytochrome c oxidase subunit [Grosmannia clavigera kw1407]EFX02757.1 cytochrome c oxidase subunit [Grosmannia clavigera kw1407]